MKAIIQFYTKAGAVESLAAFYDSCAIIEVDEYRDYEKVNRSASHISSEMERLLCFKFAWT